MSGLVADNRTQLKPAVDKLNGVLEILDNRKAGTAAHAVSAAALRDVVRRGAGRRTVLQGVGGEPAARPVRPAVHRRRVLRSGSGSQRAVAVAARRPRGRPARHPGAAGALPADRAGRGAASDAARRDHRQSGDPRYTCREPLPGTAATRTASRCLHRRPVGRHRGRPPSARPPANCRRRPFAPPILQLRSGVRRDPRMPKAAAVNKRIVRIATAASLVVILAVAITVVATPWWKKVGKAHLLRVLRQRQRPLHRRRGPHPRCRSRHGRDDRTAARAHQGHLLGRQAVPGACRRQARRFCRRRWSAPAPSSWYPAYSGGPKLAAGATIPQERTAVPIEWDDFRQQLEKLTDSLQPTTPGGPSAVGEFINTAADNLRGQGDTARDTVIKLSQAVSALGDHSTDIFSTVRNLQLLVSALSSSSDLLAAFNTNLADVTTVLSNTPNEIADATHGTGRRGERPARLRRREPGRPGRHLRPPQRDHHRTERQPRGRQAGAAHRADGVPELHEHLPARAERCHRHPGAGQLRQHRSIHLQRNPSRVAAEASSSRQSCACSTLRRSSRTASTTSRRSASIRSSGASARPNEITYSEDRLNPHLPPAAVPAAGRRRRTAACRSAAVCRTAAAANPTDPGQGLEGLMVPPGGTP